MSLFRKDQTPSAEKPQEETVPETKAETKPRRSTGTLIIKIISGVVVLFSLLLLCYAIFLLIYDSADSSYSEDGYITLDGGNITKSKEVYSQFGKEKEKKAADFALVGTKLFLSETKITPSLLSSENVASFVGEGNSNFYLYNLTLDSSRSQAQSNFNENQYYIDLNHVAEGDYLVYSDSATDNEKSKINPYSLSTNETVHYVSYTLPDKDTGIRKRITIRNNKVSPFLLINVKACGSTLPADYYDAVVFPGEYEESADHVFSRKETSESGNKDLSTLIETNFSSSDSKYKVRWVSSLQDAYESKATLSFAIGSTTNDITSLFTIQDSSYQTNTLTSNALNGYDANPEIREMTGYLDEAGKHYSGVVGNDVMISSSSHVGKESFLLKDDIESITKKILTQFTR